MAILDSRFSCIESISEKRNNFVSSGFYVCTRGNRKMNGVIFKMKWSVFGFISRYSLPYHSFCCYTCFNFMFYKQHLGIEGYFIVLNLVLSFVGLFVHVWALFILDFDRKFQFKFRFLFLKVENSLHRIMYRSRIETVLSLSMCMQHCYGKRETKAHKQQSILATFGIISAYNSFKVFYKFSEFYGG